jgi:hypothetical protein
MPSPKIFRRAIEFFIDHVTATSITLHVNLQIKFYSKAHLKTPSCGCLPQAGMGMKDASAGGRKRQPRC